MKVELKKQYIPTTYRHDFSERIVSFTKGSMTVTKYSDVFHILSSRAKVDEPKHIIVSICKRSFRKPIRDILRLYTINTTIDAF